MPRPIRCRKVCGLPDNNKFGPLEKQDEKTIELINMTVDEYETIRLIDLEGLTQEECANEMNVARTTIQGIYNKARVKLADALVNGKILSIEGGEYQLCGYSECCHNNKKHCNRRCMDSFEENENDN